MSDIRCKDVSSEENGGIFLGVEVGKWVPLTTNTWDFMDTTPVRCRVQNTEVDGREGKFFGAVVVDNMLWAVVRWGDNEDPDLYKAAVIQIEKMEWEPLVKT